ncbi:MAG: S41 family peptidase [Candidatus Sericytochromatia bacterium]
MKKKLLLSFLLNIFLCFNNIGMADPLSKEVSDNFSFSKISREQITFGSCKVSNDTKEIFNGKASTLIEVEKNLEKKELGIYFDVPNNYEGKNITLSFSVKSDVIGKSLAVLVLSGNNDNKVKEENLDGKNDWKNLKISLPLDKKFKNIGIGFAINGTGKLWVNNAQLEIDNKNIMSIEPKQFLAKLDKEFDKGSNIKLKNLSENEIKNIALTGKIWGFIKAYHPKVREGSINIDYELFRLLPKVLETKNKNELNKVLYNWITKLGELPKEKRFLDKNKTYKLLVDLSFFDNELIDKELKAKLKEIEEIKRNEDNYYIQIGGADNAEFINENSYSEMKHPDDGFKILSLFRYWNDINYYFPYKNLIGEDWNKVLEEFIPKFLETKSELAYSQVLEELICRINDSHAGLNSKSVYEVDKGLKTIPIKASFIENKLVVTESLEPSIKKGDIVESINGNKINDIIKSKNKYLCASNEAGKLHILTYDIFRTNNDKSTIEVNNGTDIKNITIDTLLLRDFYKKLYKDKIELPYFRFLTKDIGYVSLGEIEFKDLEKIKTDFKNTKGLIIDIRNYPNSFVVNKFADYLYPEAKEFVIFSAVDPQNPGNFILMPKFKTGKKNPDYYKGKVIILVNNTSISQAEYTAMALKQAPKALIVGNQTMGADGNVSSINLVGSGLSTGISGIGVYNPDGSDTQRVGIKIDVEVKPTIKGIKEGKDELLEKAIALINE